MPLSTKSAEIQRLLKAFEGEASKFTDIQLSTFFVGQQGASVDRTFSSPNHAIMLWQYYGQLDSARDTDHLGTNIQESELQWGLRGAETSAFAIIEGHAYDLFVRMAQRAGSLFDEQEARTIKCRVTDEIIQSKRSAHPSAKPTVVTNDNPLAIWINFLLYHLSMTSPGREFVHKIEPDPFSLSLLALERLAEDLSIGKVDRSIRCLADINFKVAMSFPGERRGFVVDVVSALRQTLGPDSIFYDYDYQAQLARPNLDTFLQNIYRKQSELLVVFLSSEYAQKHWCGLEWRAIRDIIKTKEDDRVMFIRFDDAPVDGVLSIDGYIDARKFNPSEVANFILQRLSA
ncbi:MAG: disease resistance protein [Proteobacteria bacterium]|nr:disease resistance protein [Pseudomonadota bacterium]